jgi:hypothetical protein
MVFDGNRIILIWINGLRFFASFVLGASKNRACERGATLNLETAVDRLFIFIRPHEH